MKDVELLQKTVKYLVQLNFHGHVFRADNWVIVYRTENIDEAKRYIDVLASLIAATNSTSRCAGQSRRFDHENACYDADQLTDGLKFCGFIPKIYRKNAQVNMASHIDKAGGTQRLHHALRRRTGLNRVPVIPPQF